MNDTVQKLMDMVYAYTHAYAWTSDSSPATLAAHAALEAELTRLFTPLSDDQIQEAATLAVKRKELNWAGFRLDSDGFYTIPVLSASHMKLMRIAEQAHGIGE